MPSRADSPAPMNLPRFRKAIEIYLAKAYLSGNVPGFVQRRLDWREDLDFGTMLKEAPFEKTPAPDAPGGAIYSLRLGNEHYPHMKVQIQAWPASSGFLLSINAHDEVLTAITDASSLAQSQAIRESNARLKQEIEADWEEAGFATFQWYLRDYLESVGGRNHAVGSGASC